MKRMTLFKKWWLLTIKGILILLFGIIALALPETTILALTIWFGAIILIGGIIQMISLWLFRKRLGEGWGWFVFEGLMDVILGLLVLNYPKITIVIFTLLLAFWLFLAGVFQINYAYQLRKVLRSWWIPLLNGMIITMFGILVWFNPFQGTIALTFLIGLASVFLGSMLIYFSLRLKKWSKDSQEIQKMT